MRASAKPVKNIPWLEHRLQEHRYICKHGKGHSRWWHCHAKVWTAKSLAHARLVHDWQWRLWLPAKFYRVARCETGVRWDWDSGTYVSAFGIVRVAYDQFARELGLHTWDGHRSPWEQYRVADAIQKRYSWSAWGCGRA